MGRSAQLKAAKARAHRPPAAPAPAEESRRVVKPSARAVEAGHAGGQTGTKPSQPIERKPRGEPITDNEEEPLNGRVWWPPTTDRKRTEFAGAYWPVQIVKKSHKQYEVTYDNGEVELVNQEHVFLEDPEVEFGEEVLPMQPGEFVEVHNGSTTDPCAWLAKMVRTDDKGMHWVEFPFHDPEVPQKARPEHVRRARVMDHGEWKLVEPKQTWEDGEVVSPHELMTIDEEELGQHVDLPAAAPEAPAAAGGSSKRSAKVAPPKAPEAASKRKGSADEGAPPPRRGRTGSAEAAAKASADSE